MRQLILFFLFITLFNSQSVFGQKNDAIFQVRSFSIDQSIVNYSPVKAGKTWYYTRVDKQAVIQNTVPATADVPIANFLLKENIVTGYSRAGVGGLIAVSIGPDQSSVVKRVKDNKIWFAYQDKYGMLSRYFEFAENSSNYSCTTPFLTSDGTQLYFASDRPGGFGGFDIYVCDYRGKEWTKPRNLGPLINSAKDELFPYLDGDMLFFSSNGHTNRAMDILIADMEGGKGRVVFDPGEPINTTADDYGMTFDTEHSMGYLISDRSGTSRQLYAVENIKKLLLINIKSLENKTPLGGAKIDMSRCRRSSFYVNSAGSIIMPVNPGENCFINIDKIGYTGTSLKLDYSAIKGLKKSVDILLSTEGLFYSGRLVDQDGAPAPEVQVTMVDQASGDFQVTYTDENGNYRFAMEPISYYLIRTISPYYNPIETKVATRVSIPADVLGTLKVYNNGSPRSGKMIESPKANEVTPTNEAPVKNTAATIENSTKDIAPVITQVTETPSAAVRYAIQLSAVNGNNIDLSPFVSKLKDFGTVYAVKEGNMTKARLGFFNNQEDAKLMMSRIPAEFRKGFIVQEVNPESNFLKSAQSNTKLVETQKPETKSRQIEKADQAPMIKNVPEKTSSNAISNTEYKIRLSSLKDPKLFNGSKVKEYGLIEEVKSGNLVIFYLSGFASLDEVRKILPDVRAQGFPTAHIVSYANGEYSKVE